MKKLIIPIVAIMFALLAAAPFAVYAQEVATDVPTFETATIESFPTVAQEPVTIEPVPTDAPTETPVPVPPVVDVTQIPSWVGVLIIVLVLAFVTVGGGAILVAARLAPRWAVEMLLTAAKTGVNSLEDYTKTTTTPLDDLGVEEVRKWMADFEAKLNATNVKVNAVTGQVNENTAAVQAVARSQNVG